jgi:hypothetical protein
MRLSDDEDEPLTTTKKGFGDDATPCPQNYKPNISLYLHKLLQKPQEKTFSSLGKHYYGENQDVKIDEAVLAPWPVRGVSLAPPKFSNRHYRLSTNIATQ